jgi:3-O-methylgallate 3,4-dioxygenase
MANIVLGVGTSHSTQLSLTPDWWPAQGQIDRGRTAYDDLVRDAPAWMPEQLTPDVWQAKYDAIQSGIETLRATIADAAPDVLIVVGDDQHELFLNDSIPAFSVFWGKEIWDIPGSTEHLAPSHKAGRWAVHADVPEAYPVASDLGRHLVEQLIAAEFDVSQFTEQPAGRSVGHAWTFVKRRLMGDRLIPIVPVMLNTYFPPNQPTPKRCFALGQAIRRAVEAWPGEQRVGVVASGGLSHFVIDEDLDRRVIHGMANKDAESLTSIPMDKLQSGSSEILNWICSAGALEHLDMTLHAYIPSYRTLAGTGCGVTFATWA